MRPGGGRFVVGKGVVLEPEDVNTGLGASDEPARAFKLCNRSQNVNTAKKQKRHLQPAARCRSYLTPAIQPPRSATARFASNNRATK